MWQRLANAVLISKWPTVPRSMHRNLRRFRRDLGLGASLGSAVDTQSGTVILYTSGCHALEEEEEREAETGAIGGPAVSERDAPLGLVAGDHHRDRHRCRGDRRRVQRRFFLAPECALEHSPVDGDAKARRMWSSSADVLSVGRRSGVRSQRLITGRRACGRRAGCAFRPIMNAHWAQPLRGRS